MPAALSTPVFDRVTDDGVRRVHVLHLLPDLSIGGGQTIVHQHVRHHDRSRFSITVVTVGADQAMRPTFEAAGASTVALDLERDGRVKVLRQLVRLIRELPVDVIHVHTDGERPLGHVAGLLTGVPVVGHLHGEWIHFGPHAPPKAGRGARARCAVAAKLRDGLERAAVRHYIAESRAVEDLFRPVLRRPVTVLHQSVSVDEIDAAIDADSATSVRAELGIGPHTPVVISVARMVEGKGHGELLTAFRRVLLEHPDAVLLMVGDGPLRPGIEAQVVASGLEGSVRVLGDRFDVPSLLPASDVFVLASSTEGFGLVVLEAMAARLPVVAYDLPAFSEFAANGTTSILVPIGDTDALAAGIEHVLDDPHLAQRLGLAGRAVVDRRFPPGSTARTFEAVYDIVCERR